METSAFNDKVIETINGYSERAKVKIVAKDEYMLEGITAHKIVATETSYEFPVINLEKDLRAKIEELFVVVASRAYSELRPGTLEYFITFRPSNTYVIEESLSITIGLFAIRHAIDVEVAIS